MRFLQNFIKAKQNTAQGQPVLREYSSGRLGELESPWVPASCRRTHVQHPGELDWEFWLCPGAGSGSPSPAEGGGDAVPCSAPGPQRWHRKLGRDASSPGEGATTSVGTTC